MGSSESKPEPTGAADAVASTASPGIESPAVAGKGDLPKIVLTHRSGSSAELYLHGAHITSWKSADGKELIFVSEKAIFKPPKAIRGGVPVCFPQFNDMGKGPAHGFARNTTWTLDSLNKPKSKAVLSLKPTEEQLKSYPFPFELKMEVEILKDQLKQTMTVKNTGKEAMQFTTALHTYFSVSDIGNVRIRGLSKLEYLDNLAGRVKTKEMDKDIKIDKEVDRIYLNTPNKIQIVDEKKGTITLDKKGLPDAVLWNPWIEKAKATADFGDSEYHNMVCVEAAYAGTGTVEVKKNATWTCSQTFSYSKKA